MFTKKIITSLVWFGCNLLVDAQVASPVQSAARPYNLNIVGPVEIAGSDAAAKTFQTNVLPGLLDTVKQVLPEYKSHTVADLAAISSGASLLKINADSTARVYFLTEGAGNRNTLGISTTGGSPLSPDAALIFPNASSSTGYGGSGSLVRTSNEPLVPGDFVNLGSFKAGTALDFFLIASGATGGTDFFSTNSSLNKDGIIHSVTMAANGSTYLIIGFEDLKGGGDRDFNDVVIAVEVTPSIVPHIAGIGAPEPSLATGALITCLALLGFTRRRRH
ncbi:MAG: DUF4114 domain-containing protein [Verrucomicrobiota bacterium]